MNFSTGDYIVITRFSANTDKTYPNDLKACIFRFIAIEESGLIKVQHIISKNEYTFEIDNDIIPFGHFLSEFENTQQTKLREEFESYLTDANIPLDGLDELFNSGQRS